MKALIAAWKEILDIIAKHCLKTALKRQFFNATNSVIPVQDELFMFLKKTFQK